VVFDTSSIVGNVQSVVGTGINVIWYVILGFIILFMLAGIVAIFYFKKRWNLTVIFELTRNDAKLTNCEIGKGFYDSKKGVVFVRRPTMGKFSKGVAMRIFDIRRYLQSGDVLHVIQVGPEDFRPILVDSWTEHIETYKDDKTGEVKEVKESILNIKVDSGLNKAWKSSWDSAAKNAYSIRNFMTQFQTPIAIGIVIVCCFVGFAVLWSKVN